MFPPLCQRRDVEKSPHQALEISALPVDSLNSLTLLPRLQSLQWIISQIHLLVNTFTNFLPVGPSHVLSKVPAAVGPEKTFWIWGASPCTHLVLHRSKWDSQSLDSASWPTEAIVFRGLERGSSPRRFSGPIHVIAVDSKVSLQERELKWRAWRSTGDGIFADAVDCKTTGLMLE